MRVRKPIRAKKSPRPKRAIAAKRATRVRSAVKFKKAHVAAAAAATAAPTALVVSSGSQTPASRSNGAWAFVLVMVCLSAAAMLSAALRSGEIAEDADADAPATAVVVDSLTAPLSTASIVGERPRETKPVEPTRPVDPPARGNASTAKPAVAPPVALEETPFERAPLEPAARVFPEPPPTTSSPLATAGSQAPAVTITGCLERDDETFRLRNTSGEAAPKARSWKSGFLRRSSATIDVVDVANRLALSSHVGRRVALTGTLVDREMTARTLQTVAASCDQST
jgi:hypothetical protein